MEILKAIADENRYQIIELLIEKRYCVRALARKLNITESAVSQHLKILKAHELVYGVKKGYFMHYHVNVEKIKEIAEKLSKLCSLNS